MDISEQTIADLRSTLRRTFTVYRDKNLYKFETNGIVDIDKLVLKLWSIPKKKDKPNTRIIPHISRFYKQLWIFGITERGTNSNSKIHFHCDIMYARPSYDNPTDTVRNSREVDRILELRLLQNAAVISDQHSMYLKLKTRMGELGINIGNNTINKREVKNIITDQNKPNSKIYTQSIENIKVIY